MGGGSGTVKMRRGRGSEKSRENRGKASKREKTTHKGIMKKGKDGCGKSSGKASEKRSVC